MKHPALSDALTARSALFGVSLLPGAAQALVAVLERLGQEEQNLTAIRDVSDALERHLLDSLVAIGVPELATGRSIVDVGSGAGFPGLALAAALPDVAVTLVESEGRKADWLRRAADPFPNVRVVNARAETLAATERGGWDVAVARALGPLPVVVELCAPLVADPGAVVVWRGRRDPGEESRGDAAAAAVGFGPARVEPVAPYAGVERHLAVFTRTSETPSRFPRRPGRAAQRPLA